MIEVATGKETGEAIDRAQFGPPAWTDDNRLLYNRLPKLAPDAPRSDKYLQSRVVRAHARQPTPNAIAPSWDPASHQDIVFEPLATPIVFTAPGSAHVIGIVGNGNQREVALYVAPVASLAQASSGVAASSPHSTTK